MRERERGTAKSFLPLYQDLICMYLYARTNYIWLETIFKKKRKRKKKKKNIKRLDRFEIYLALIYFVFGLTTTNFHKCLNYMII